MEMLGSIRGDKHEFCLVVIYLSMFAVALTPPLSTPLAPGNCGQIHMWRVRGFPLEAHPKGGNYDGVERLGRRRRPHVGTELPAV